MSTENEHRPGPSRGVRSRGVFAGIVHRPIALMVLFATLIVVGVIAYSRIPLQLLPSNFSQPRLNVWIDNPGSSAEENEEQIARVVEDQLRTLTGIEETYSRSSDGSVYMRIEFNGDVDMDLARSEVRDRLERARPLLPKTAETPSMWTESASTLPISFFGILVQGDSQESDYLMEKVVVPRLEAVPGIGKVDMWGVLQDSVRILLDEDKVAAAQLDIGSLIRRLASDNFAMPLGEIDDGGREVILRTDMRFTSLEEIANYPIRDGLTIGDVAQVSRVKSVDDTVSRIDGAFAYYGMATKDSQSNVVEVSNALEQTLKDLGKDPALRGKFSAIPFFLQGKMIEGALGQLRATAAWGGVLAVLVLFVFLRRVRLTLCVALSIPVSALMALLWEYSTGGSFNILTMTGITLAIGMLVDNAVVVVENIAREHQEGFSPLEAAVVGTRDIALAVTLATLTTVVVFMPIIFLGSDGTLRTIFASIGLPFSAALLASLLAAVVFLPVVTGRVLGDRPLSAQRVGRFLAPVLALPARLVALVVGGVRWTWYQIVRLLHRACRAVLRVASPLRFVLALAAVGLLVLRIPGLHSALSAGDSLGEFGHPVGPFPGKSPAAAGKIFLTLEGLALGLLLLLLLLGLPRWRRRPAAPPRRPARFVPESDSVVGMVVDANHALVSWTLSHRLLASGIALLAFLSIVIPMTTVTVSPFGEDATDNSIDFRAEFNAKLTLDEAVDEARPYEDFLESKRAEWGFDHWTSRIDEDDARFSVYWDQVRPQKELDELQRQVQREVPRVSGHTLRFYDGEQASDTSREYATFTLQGPDPKELERLGDQAVQILSKVPGLLEVTSGMEDAPDEISVQVDRDLAQGFSVSSDAVQQTISWVLRGFPLPRYQERGRDVPFLIEYDADEIAGLPTLRDMSVFSPEGAVPLSSVASLHFGKAPSSIVRTNGKITYSIWAKVEDPLRIVPISEAGQEALRSGLDLPRGFTIGTDDTALARQQEETTQLWFALGLSIVLVFLLMGILFESVLLPVSVLFTIPFALVGSWWTLLITGTPMDSMGWIGIIILAGVVVNNGIVLVDRIHALRTSGIERSTAVVQGCSQRVRPVLMTALTTVCGLFPMMVSAPPPGGSIDYRALATIVGGGLIASTVFTLWVVPLAYTVIDDLDSVIVGQGRWWFRQAVRGLARLVRPRTRRPVG